MIFLLLVLLPAGGGLFAAEPSVFQGFCADSAAAADVKKTLDVLLEQAGTADCVEAEKRLRRVFELKLNYRELRSLEPLAGFHQLRHLNLASNLIGDLTPLAGLARLESLDLSYNLVSDLSPLSGLARLRRLNLHSNRVRSLAPLRRLERLEALSVQENRIRDLGPLQDLPRLRNLWALSNPLQDKTCPLRNPVSCVVDYARCTADLKRERRVYAGWSAPGSPEPLIKTAWTPRTPGSCPNKGYPAFSAFSGEASAWIQIIEVTSPNPKTGEFPWVFVDTDGKTRSRGEPFYRRGPRWRDAPSWGVVQRELKRLPGRRRDWRGHLFPVRLEGKRVIPLGGVVWGYSWILGRSEPEPIAPSPLKPADWERYRKLLERDSPGFEYAAAALSGMD